MKYLQTVAACAALFALAVPALAQMNAPPVPMTASQFAQANGGESVQIEVRIRSVNRSMLDTELLVRESDSVLKSTGKSVAIFFADGTPVVMGAASDVAAGAVLYVYGVLTKPGHVDAKRVVLVTKYVTVR
jgi:hypothetical protein